jgi:hypothetical protein
LCACVVGCFVAPPILGRPHRFIFLRPCRLISAARLRLQQKCAGQYAGEAGAVCEPRRLVSAPANQNFTVLALDRVCVTDIVAAVSDRTSRAPNAFVQCFSVDNGGHGDQRDPHSALLPAAHARRTARGHGVEPRGDRAPDPLGRGDARTRAAGPRRYGALHIRCHPPSIPPAPQPPRRRRARSTTPGLVAGRGDVARVARCLRATGRHFSLHSGVRGERVTFSAEVPRLPSVGRRN